MGIADFFRPKYRHSDVKVRLEAVRALTSEDSDILANIARTDREATVRRVAIEKLDEAPVLAEIAKEESDRTLRDLAGTRAAALWVSRACQDGDGAEAALDGLFDLGDQRALAEVAARAARPQVRTTALGRIDDQRALAELAKQTSHQGLRTQALERITDPDVLGAIALDTTTKELGIAAVERFEEEDVLEKVAQKAKHKAIRARARRKLEELADDRRASAPKVSDAQRRRQAEQAQLLRELSALHETHEWEKSLATVTHIEAEWAKLAGADDPVIEERFQKEVSRYHERRKAAIELVEAHRHEIEEKRRSAEHKVVAPPPEVTPAALAAAAVPRDERQTVRIKPEAVAVGAAAAEQRAAEKKEQEERAKAIAASLDALLGEMQTMLESTDGRAIDRLLGQAAKAFEQVTRVAGEQRRGLEDRYHQTRSALVIKVQELREAEDWKQWANVPRAEALIREAAAMLEAEEPPQLDKLKDLQGRWKGVGAIPRKKSQELWEKFKATCDQVFEKVKAGRAVVAEKAAAATAVKEELITQAEALAESTDWDATAEVFKELQRRWKESGNVPRKQGDALWKRFRTACDRFFERRKPHLEAHLAEQQENLEAKTALCERAEAVVAGAPPEAGWGAAINEIKELQRRWKDIGYVPRKDADQIYQRFRTACDGLFAKRDAARDAESDARRAELDAVRTSLAEAAADPARVIALRATLKELASRDVRPDPALAAEIDRVTIEALNANPAGFAGTELDVEAMRARREKLLAKADELLPKERPTIEANLSPDEIVARLKSAMASNALGDFRGAGRDPFEAVHELRTAWNEIGPVVGEASETLAARFAEICRQVIAGAEAEGRRDMSERPPREDRPRREERPRRERRERRPREESAPVPAAAPAAAAAAVAAPAPAPASEEAHAAPSTDPDPAPAPDPVPDPAPAPAPAPSAPEADVDSGWD